MGMTVPCYALDSTSGMGVGPQIYDLKRRSLWAFSTEKLAADLGALTAKA